MGASLGTTAWTVLARFGTSVDEQPPGAVERFVEDNGLLVGTVGFLVLMVFGIAWTGAAYHRTARQRAMEPTAAEHGLAFSRSDPFDCTQVAFPLFRAGDGRIVENVMWRDGADRQDLRVFDYSFYDEWTDENQRLHRRYRHFTCAMARHNGLWPPVRIVRERAVDRLAQKIGLPDIELESEEFNRTFLIQCEDRRFATDLLSPDMMEFLLTTAGLVDFETKGRWLLITTERLPAKDMPGLLGVADEFVKRIPPLIWELYPKAPDAPGGDGDESDGAITAEGIGPMLSDLAPAVGSAMLDERSQPEQRIEYDLDGNPVAPIEEDPWG